MDPGRSRPVLRHRPGEADLGGGVRFGVPDPDVGRRHALNKPATASSTEAAAYPASAAVDGSLTTRWASAFADPQWIQVDLGQSYAIGRVKLTWEAAYGSAYQIQTSADGTFEVYS
ncbi:discoidin domain-containing protein [Dactylosporangium aurantiacum]|uniref:discoidin domain-containing protein n=1 Tax=Dactylosporangium aurantiacum TaxID=35754 RepID=UPI001FE019EE|nr:discoidin domain-containing protein [Dactylosporangium aurantiacum]